jgi:hypothetical protein
MVWMVVGRFSSAFCTLCTLYTFLRASAASAPSAPPLLGLPPWPARLGTSWPDETQRLPAVTSVTWCQPDLPAALVTAVATWDAGSSGAPARE